MELPKPADAMEETICAFKLNPQFQISRHILLRGVATLASAEALGARKMGLKVGTYSSGQKYVVLQNGRQMPLLGLGTCVGDLDDTEAAVRHAVEKVGYRHIDTARMYHIEPAVGKALSKASIPRGDIWITSKLDNADHDPQKVADVCREQLRDVQTDYFDLFLVHWPVTGKAGPALDPPMEDTWRAMEKLVDDGMCRSIGVSNFSVKKLKDLQSYARIQPVVNQVEVHCWFRNPKLVEYCRQTDVHITAYSPTGGNPDYSGPRPWEDEVVKSIAKKYSRTVQQVLLAWNVKAGRSVIPKSTKLDRVEQNSKIWDWQLSEEDFERLSSIKTQIRMGSGKEFLEESPYNSLEELWDGEIYDTFEPRQ